MDSVRIKVGGMHVQTSISSEAKSWVKTRARRPFRLALMVLVVPVALRPSAGHALPKPGPEKSGLRLRLLVSSKTGTSNDSYSVRADLINVTDRPITVVANWPSDREKGDFKDYFESALSIRTAPEIMHWQRQVISDHRQLPQPTAVLQPKQTLTVRWEASGRRLKNKLTRPLEVRNPYFPSDGRYKIRAQLQLRVVGSDKPILLRSNPRSVTIGGKTHTPKFPLATVSSVSKASKSAIIDLGWLHAIKTNDQFLVRTGTTDWWMLTVVETDDRWSTVAVKPCDWFASRTNEPFPKAGMKAGLVPRFARDTSWMWPYDKGRTKTNPITLSVSR